MLPALSKRLAEHMLEVNPSMISETEIIWDVIFYLLCSTPVGCRGDEVWDGLQLVEDANQINYEPLSKMSKRNGIPSRGLLLPTWLAIVKRRGIDHDVWSCLSYFKNVTTRQNDTPYSSPCKYDYPNDVPVEQKSDLRTKKV